MDQTRVSRLSGEHRDEVTPSWQQMASPFSSRRTACRAWAGLMCSKPREMLRWLVRTGAFGLPSEQRG